ncbi:MAG: hypothetical protein Tsb009_19530 [Planctomycetaceae bacterium]
MTIEFECNNCRNVLRTSDDKAGATAKCPECGSLVNVPAAVEDTGFEFLDDESEFSFEDDNAYAAQEPRRSRYASRSGASDFSSPQQRVTTKPCPMCGEQIRIAAIRCHHCGEDLDDEYSDGDYSRRQLDYAGFWLRFVAYIIDLFIVIIPVSVIFVAFDLIFNIQRPVQAEIAMSNSRTIIVWGSIWCYKSLMEASPSQASLGKMALGLIVVDESGNRISFGRALGRNFSQVLSYFICCAGFIIAGFTERKQALHDLIAGCLVIRK